MGLVSGEIRWFWRGDALAGLREWFCGIENHPCPAGGGGERVDLGLELEDTEKVLISPTSPDTSLQTDPCRHSHGV